MTLFKFYDIYTLVLIYYLFNYGDNRLMKIKIHIQRTLRSHAVSITFAFLIVGFPAFGAMKGDAIDLWNIHNSNSISETPIETPTDPPTPFLTPVPTPTSAPTMQIAKRVYTLGKFCDENDPAAIYDVAFSSDNQRIFTADYKKRVIVWNKNTSEILHIFQSDIEYPYTLQVTQNGNHVWLGGQHHGGHKIVGWDTDTGEEFFLKEWKSIFYAWEFMPDDASILYGSWSDGAFLIDRKSGDVLKRYTAPEGFRQIRFLKLSPQGDLALFAELDDLDFPNYTQVSIWNLKTGKVIHSFPYYKRRVENVFWSNDSNYVFLHSWANRPDGELDDCYLDQYEVRTGEHIFRQIVSSDNRIALSPEGTRILTVRYQDGVASRRIFYVDLIDYYTGNILKSYPHIQPINTMAFSSDSAEIIAGSSNLVDTAAAYLWSIANVPTVAIPTLIPYTPTPTFTTTPTFTPTPTYTPTLTPTPDSPHDIAETYQLRELKENVDLFALHPQTGDVVTMRFLYDPYQSNSPTRLQFSILQPSTFAFGETKNPTYTIEVPNFGFGVDMGISSTGSIYLLGNRLIEISPYKQDQSVRSWDVAGLDFHIVDEKDRIPNTKAGDVVILQQSTVDEESQTLGYLGGVNNQVVIFDPTTSSISSTPLVSKKLLPRGMPIENMTIGPNNRLFFISKNLSKIFYLDNDGSIQEYVHCTIPLYPTSFAYLPASQSFAIGAKFGSWDYITRELWSLSISDYSLSQMASLMNYGKIKTSPIDGQTLYFKHQKNNIENLYSIRPSTPIETPTAVPIIETPTATPTPVPGWFVLDGFGGIHSSNPDIKPPLLPYFYDFNIVRDIEPDPLGRGWYMLDGYGGIHRSSPDLPIPQGLPYFGFDIARDLEIKEDKTGFHFYMLDGYGVVHTTGEKFNFGFLPWFGQDVMRDLEPDPHGHGWLMMDDRGYIYSNEAPKADSIRFAWPQIFSPIMRSFVRFPDDKTVMIDSWGGRHTNPYYPISRQNYGPLEYVYFPGWEIIWDIEAVPEQTIETGGAGSAN